MAVEKEKLLQKYSKAEAVLATLTEGLSDIKDVEKLAACAQTSPEKLYKTFPDSIVQCFEYTFDLTWKYVSEYLQFQGRTVEIKMPKSIFRECLKAKLLYDAQVRLAIEMVDHRNLTTHGYDEKIIEEISKSIPEYRNLLEDILDITKPVIQKS